MLKSRQIHAFSHKIMQLDIKHFIVLQTLIQNFEILEQGFLLVIVLMVASLFTESRHIDIDLFVVQIVTSAGLLPHFIVEKNCIARITLVQNFAAVQAVHIICGAHFVFVVGIGHHEVIREQQVALDICHFVAVRSAAFAHHLERRAMPSIRTYLLRFLDETSRKRHIVKQVLCPPQILKVFDTLVLADLHIFQMVRTDNPFDRLHAFLACRRDDAVLAAILCTNFKQNT